VRGRAAQRWGLPGARGACGQNHGVAQRSGTGGLDVDARFLLANERTLLAWVRTALTLLAGGVGVAQFGTAVGARTWLAVLLVGLGVAAAAAGGVRYTAADRAIRAGRLPVTGPAPLVLPAVVALVGLGLLVAVLAGR